jgi:hypothetical protein
VAAGQSRVAGEYVYEEYVDYENDAEYTFVVYENVTEHGDRAGEGNGESPEDVEPEATAADADADVEVKRKGGSRKGRGVAASSSSR